MLENIKGEIEALKAAQKEKLDFLNQLRNTAAQTEAELHQLSGAIAMCEKLLAPAATDDARKTK